MSALAMTLPWRHATPLYTPRRDLAADAADSLSLTVTVVETDTPNAPPADLATGPTFPCFWLRIWSTASGWGPWDYGGLALGSGTALWAGEGTIDATLPGAVDFLLPLGSMQGWPPRCGWAVYVQHDVGLRDTLCTGYLHLRGAGRSATPTGAFRLNSSVLG
jgi:hypothetical protein